MKDQNSKNQNSDDLLKHEAEIAYGFLLQLRNTDLNLLWTRSLIFLGIEGVILGFVLVNFNKPSEMLSIMSGFGVIVALFWLIITFSGCSWLESWEEQLKCVEGKVLPNSPDIPIFRENKERRKKTKHIRIKFALKLFAFVNMVIWIILFILLRLHWLF